MSTILKVLSQPIYVATAVVITLAVIVFAAWLPNLHLITSVMTRSTMSANEKAGLMIGLMGSLRTNFTLWSQIVTVVSGMLAGLQVSLLIYYLKQAVRANREMGVSVAGVATSLLGVGCASCGSVVLTSFIGLGATTAITGALPLKGQEFGLAGMSFLLFAIYLTVKKINEPLVCQLRQPS